MTPALAFSTSDAVDFSWLEVSDRSDRNRDIQRLRRGFGTGQIGLRLRDRNLIVLRIDLHQHGAFLHPLVVVHVDLHHVAGNTRADRIQVNIRLGIVG